MDTNEKFDGYLKKIFLTEYITINMLDEKDIKYNEFLLLLHLLFENNDDEFDLELLHILVKKLLNDKKKQNESGESDIKKRKPKFFFNVNRILKGNLSLIIWLMVMGGGEGGVQIWYKSYIGNILNSMMSVKTNFFMNYLF